MTPVSTMSHRPAEQRLVVLIGVGSQVEELARLMTLHGLEARTFAEPREFALSDAGRPEVVVLFSSAPSLGLQAVLGLTNQVGGPPILIVAKSSDYVERVVALERGVDDVVDDTCHLRELLARIRALARRAGARSGKQDVEVGGADGQWVLCSLTRTLTSPTGARYALTNTELEFLAEHIRASNSPDGLPATEVVLAGAEADMKSRMTASRMRRKFASKTGESLPLTTVRGRGYHFEEPIVLRSNMG